MAAIKLFRHFFFGNVFLPVGFFFFFFFALSIFVGSDWVFTGFFYWVSRRFDGSLRNKKQKWKSRETFTCATVTHTHTQRGNNKEPKRRRPNRTGRCGSPYATVDIDDVISFEDSFPLPPPKEKK